MEEVLRLSFFLRRRAQVPVCLVPLFHWNLLLVYN
jgi:hypothetical protein